MEGNGWAVFLGHGFVDNAEPGWAGCAFVREKGEGIGILEVTSQLGGQCVGKSPFFVCLVL